MRHHPCRRLQFDVFGDFLSVIACALSMWVEKKLKSNGPRWNSYKADKNKARKSSGYCNTPQHLEGLARADYHPDENVWDTFFPEFLQYSLPRPSTHASWMTVPKWFPHYNIGRGEGEKCELLPKRHFVYAKKNQTNKKRKIVNSGYCSSSPTLFWPRL